MPSAQRNGDGRHEKRSAKHETVCDLPEDVGPATWANTSSKLKMDTSPPQLEAQRFLPKSVLYDEPKTGTAFIC